MRVLSEASRAARAVDIVARVAAVVLCALLLASCSKTPPSQPISKQQKAEYDAVFATAKWTPAVQVKFSRSCALCHAAGQGGAPRVGDKAAWAKRLAQGKAILLKHTLDGYKRMPPLGYCMECEMSDFAAMIDMMSSGSK